MAGPLACMRCVCAAGLVLVIAAGVLMGLVSGVLLLFAALIIVRRSFSASFHSSLFV